MSMKGRNKAGLLMAMASMFAEPYNHNNRRTPTDEEIRKFEEERKRRERENEEKRNLKKGLKPFEINGEIHWAINEKNAIKKYNKKKSSMNPKEIRIKCTRFVGVLNEPHAKCEQCGKEEWCHKR